MLAGTPVQAKLQSIVKTDLSRPGDEVVAVVTDPIRVQGSRLNGRVETIQAATHTTEGRVRLVFREIEFPDGRRASTWITNSFSASPPKRNRRYFIFVGIGGAGGGLIGGKAARVAGIIGGGLIGFVLAGNSGNIKLPDLTLKPGQVLHLELGEDLIVP